MKLTFDLDGYQAGRANKQLQLAQQCFYDPPSDQTNVIFQGNLLGYRQVNRPSSYRSLVFDDTRFVILFNGDRRDLHSIRETIEIILGKSLDQCMPLEQHYEVETLGNLKLVAPYYDDWDTIVSRFIHLLNMEGLNSLIEQIETGYIPFTEEIQCCLKTTLDAYPPLPEDGTIEYRRASIMGTLSVLMVADMMRRRVKQLQLI